MPRRPRRSCQLLPQPLTFSPFVRSIARLTSSYVLKQKAGGKLPQKGSSNLSDDGITKDKLGENFHQSKSSDDVGPEEEVQADFSFFDPKPDDFHGLKVLLQTYLDDKEWDSSGFVDLILAQTTVGTVVKIEDDEDDGLFALVTTLNLGRYKDHKCIREVKKYLQQVCQDGALLGKLRVLVEDQAEDVGLLVSQRVMNLPPQLLPHLYDALFDEISWATEDEPTAELCRSFQFRYYLVISRIYKKNAQNRKGHNPSNEDDIIYVKPEDEIFHKVAVWSFTFPLRTKKPEAHELRKYQLMGLVMIVEADKAPVFRQQLRSLLSES